MSNDHSDFNNEEAETQVGTGGQQVRDDLVSQ